VSRITEVNLVGRLKVLSESRPDQKVDVIALSPSGAYIKSLSNQVVGEPILLNLKMDEPVEIRGHINRQSSSGDSKSVFYVSFEELDRVQHQAVEQITSYYLKLKKAGVHLESPVEEGPTNP